MYNSPVLIAWCRGAMNTYDIDRFDLHEHTRSVCAREVSHAETNLLGGRKFNLAISDASISFRRRVIGVHGDL